MLKGNTVFQRQKSRSRDKRRRGTLGRWAFLVVIDTCILEKLAAVRGIEGGENQARERTQGFLSRRYPYASIHIFIFNHNGLYTLKSSSLLCVTGKTMSLLSPFTPHPRQLSWGISDTYLTHCLKISIIYGIRWKPLICHSLFIIIILLHLHYQLVLNCSRWPLHIVLGLWGFYCQEIGWWVCLVNISHGPEVCVCDVGSVHSSHAKYLRW